MLPDLSGIQGISLRGKTYRNGEEFRVKMMSDLHIGAHACNRKHINQDLEDAKRTGARILLGGDIFDGILTRDMKRFEPEVLDRQIRGRNDILNATLDLGVEILAPYADQIDVICEGNHETSVLKHHNISLIPLLIDRLSTPDHVIQFGGYKAIIRYRHVQSDGGGTRSVSILFFHGAGGASPVTGGTIDLYRLASEVDGVNVVWTAHKHTKAYRGFVKYRMDTAGKIIPSNVHAFISPSYLDMIERGYSVQAGHRPEPHGGVTFKYWWEGNERKLVTKLEL